MAEPKSYARVAPRGTSDEGTLRGFYRATDPRLSKLPPDELVELTPEQWGTWILKQDSRWNFERRELEVRAYASKMPTAEEELFCRIDRRLEFVALLRLLSRRLGISLADLRAELGAEATVAFDEVREALGSRP